MATNKDPKANDPKWYLKHLFKEVYTGACILSVSG